MIYDSCQLKPENEAARLESLLELDLLDGQRFPELDRLTALAADVCSAEISVITLYTEDDGIQVSANTGDVPHGSVPRGDTFCTHILLKPHTLIIRDAATDPVFHGNRFFHEPPHARSYVGVPVCAEDQLPVGVMCVVHREPDAFSQQDIGRLEKIGPTRRSGMVAAVQARPDRKSVV